MSSHPDPLLKFKIWAVQSISFAICFRADTTGKPITSEFLGEANNDAEAAARDIWKETITEADPKASGQVITLKIVQKVFDWCSSHMNQGK